MTKKILAVLLALAMIFSLCAVDLTAAEEVETLFTKTIEDGYTGSWSTIIPQEETAEFIEACEAVDSTVTITVPGVQFAWAQFIIQSSDFTDGILVNGGDTNGSVFTVTGETVVKYWNDNKITDGGWYQICFQGTTIPEASDITIEVTAPKPDENRPEGSRLPMAKNGTYNWNGTLSWEFFDSTLNEIPLEDLEEIESIEVSFTPTGAIVDGEAVDASKIGANLVLQGIWSGWHNVEGVAEDGTYTITLSPSDFDLAADNVKTYRLLSQLYINPDDLPNGLEDTKEGYIYYKDAEVKVNKKASKPEVDGFTYTFEHPGMGTEINIFSNETIPDDFIAALKIEDAVVTLTASDSGAFGDWTNFDFRSDDHQPSSLGTVAGNTLTLPASELLAVYEKVKDEDWFNLTFNCDGVAQKITMTVEAPKEEEIDPSLSVVKLIDNGITAHGVDLSKGGAVAWGTVIIDDTDALWEEYVTALKTPGAKFTLKYKVTTTASWMNWLQGKIGDTVGHAGGLPAHTDTNSGGDLAVGTHIVTFTAEDYIALFTNHSCTPDEWNTFEHSAGDITIDDSKGMYLQSDGALDITFSDFYIVYDPTAGSIDDCKHDGELSYENNADGTHKIVCAKCKKILETAEECTYGSDGKCTKCGGEKLDPSAVKLPEGYEIVKTYTGGKTKFSSSDGTLFTIPQSEMNFEANDYIYFHITPSEGTENYQAAVQVQNIEWGSDWVGMSAGKQGDTVQFYFSELLALNPTVPLDKLQQVLVQAWDIQSGDSLDGYTFIVARMPKEEKPALPDDYIETAAIDIPEDTTLDGNVIEIVPTEEVSTSSLLVSFAEKTPCSGTIDVYFDEVSSVKPVVDKFTGEATCIELPRPVKNGESITVRFKGTAKSDFRVWLCAGNNTGAQTLCSADSIFYASKHGGYENFDFTETFVCAPQNPGDAPNTADHIMFKGASYGANVTDLTIEVLEFDSAPAAANIAAPLAEEGEVRKVSQTFDKGTWVAYVSLGEYSEEAIKKIVITSDDSTKNIKVDKILIIDPSKVPTAKKTGKTFAYAIQLSDTMHGYLVKGRMLPMPHTFVNDVCSGCGFKKKVSIAVETEKEDDKEEAKEETKKETSNKPYYTMTKTTGQNFENNISSKTGVELEISDGMTRLATDWVNKDAWDQLFKAMKDHKDGNIVMTYTGTITEIGVEHDNGGAKERDKVEITDVAEVNGKNVYTVAVADFLPVIEEALEDESWKNFYVIPDEKDGAVLYGFQIARPAAENAEEEVKLPDPYVFPLEADTKLDGWTVLVNYENEAWGSDELWTALWGDSKIEIEYTGDGEPQLIAQYGGAKGYGASISPESVKDTDDGTHIATYSGEKFREALVRDANKRGFRQDDENDPYAFFAIVIDGNIWGDDGKVVETLVYKSGRIIPSSDPAKDPEYTDFYTIKPGTELSEWTPLVWYEGSDDITEIFNEIMWLDGAKIEINYTGDALLLIAQYSDNDGNSAYSSVPEPDEIIENEDGSKTAVYDCANYIKAVRADAKQYNFDPYETVEWVFDNGHVYGYTLDGRFWDEEGNQTNSILNWAKISAPAANN